MSEMMTRFVDVWTVAWTLALVLGYVAEMTPFPQLSVLRGRPVAHVMLLSSAAVVLGLTLGERVETAAVLTAWAVVMSSVKLLWDEWESHDL